MIKIKNKNKNKEKEKNNDKNKYEKLNTENSLNDEISIFLEKTKIFFKTLFTTPLFYCFIVFIGISLFYFKNFGINIIQSLDNTIYQNILKTRSKFNTVFFGSITYLASTYFITAFLFLCFFGLKKSKNKFLVLISVILNVIVINISKLIVARPRITENMLVNESSFSFPSAHASISIALYGMLIYIICKELKDTSSKLKLYSLITILITLILLISYSRLYLGAHYLSDVIFGIISSLMLLFITIKTVNKIES